MQQKMESSLSSASGTIKPRQGFKRTRGSYTGFNRVDMIIKKENEQ
jgi:hypothetical protein